jgi:hypothetical protein
MRIQNSAETQSPKPIQSGVGILNEKRQGKTRLLSNDIVMDTNEVKLTRLPQISPVAERQKRIEERLRLMYDPESKLPQ